MAKRKEDAPPPGSPAWMATFSDLMNLLLCFFVLLFSMSTVNEEKYNEMVASMNNTFSIFNGGATAIGDGLLISNGVSQLNELDKYINSTGRLDDGETSEDINQNQGSTGETDGNPGNEGTTSGGSTGETSGEQTDSGPEVDELLGRIEEFEELLEDKNLQTNEELAENIQESVSEGNMLDQIEVGFTAQYVQLTMKGALLFDSGSAQLRPEAEAVLDKVGLILERYAGGEIEIAGHTDNIPIHSAQYDDNEELSSDRARNVFYYLIEHSNLDPVVMKHSGMGQRTPIADNATEAGRSRNRRVEIRILNPA